MRSWRASRGDPAPSARRTAISRRPRSRRARRRLAMLAHAMRSTRPTAPRSTPPRVRYVTRRHLGPRRHLERPTGVLGPLAHVLPLGRRRDRAELRVHARDVALLPQPAHDRELARLARHPVRIHPHRNPEVGPEDEQVGWHDPGDRVWHAVHLDRAADDRRSRRANRLVQSRWLSTAIAPLAVVSSQENPRPSVRTDARSSRTGRPR